MDFRFRTLFALILVGRASVSLALDTDRDGLSDLHEVNQHLTDPYHADTDRDGLDDCAEVSAGTDPLDPQSRFDFHTVNATSLPSGRRGVSLSFESKADRRYTLYRASEVQQSVWTPVLVDIRGTGGTVMLVHECAPGEDGGFYRLATFSGSSGLLTCEVWLNVAGTNIADLTKVPKYPDSPDLVKTLGLFQAPTNQADSYGQRIRGYVLPPVTGHYTFRIASADASQLWLSPDADPARRMLIASVNGSTGPQEWNKYPGQQSGQVHLEAGQPCYIEVLHKAGLGDDHLSVAWETAGLSLRVIDGAYCRHKLPLPPSVTGDAYTLMEDQTLSVAAFGVLRNDLDPDGDLLSAALGTGVQHGSLVLHADGGFSYTPDANFRGSDRFTYRATDGSHTSAAEAVVNLSVTPVPDTAVTARNDFYAPPPGDTCQVSAPGVLANDVDPDQRGLQASLLTSPQNGVLSLNTNGSFTYTAKAGFEGIDQFSYRANAGAITSAPAVVTLDMGVAASLGDSGLVLPAKTATIVPGNGSLKYENRNGYENLGNWNKGPNTPPNPYDGPVWTVNNVPVATYSASILVSGTAGNGGTFQLIVDGTPQAAQTVTPTGSWDTYVYQFAATNLLLGGTHTFKVQPTAFNGSYFCNLIHLLLTPTHTSIRLPAKDAAIVPHNGQLYYENKDGVGNLGYWNKGTNSPPDPYDGPVWTKTNLPAETYTAKILVSAASGQGGTFQLIVDGAAQPVRPLTVTGNWTNYQHQLAASNLVLSAGTHAFKVQPISFNGTYFCNLIELTLTPSSAISGAVSQSEIDACKFITGTFDLEGAVTAEAWIRALQRARASGILSTATLGEKMWKTFPLFADWFLQDNKVHSGFGGQSGFDARGDFAHYLDPGRDNALERGLVASACAELGRVSDPSLNYPAGDPRWLSHYVGLCEQRRLKRLESLRQRTDKVAYAVHMNMGTIYLATETQGCGPGSELRQLDLTPLAGGGSLVNSRLFNAGDGIVRDPDISFDGQRMAFAWRKERNGYATTGRLADPDGHYKIHEMDLATRVVRQLTFDENDPFNLGTYGADFEPCYLPNDNILFSSARIVQEVTCGWGDCSNLHIMDKHGRYARRLGFDQTQTAFPHLLNDGRVVFTRRDYNDRGQTYAHALFTMNADGTQQTEYYGNNTFEPTSLQHTRPIPGTDMTLSIAGGYHTTQGGKLVRINPNKGRQDYSGLEFQKWNYTTKTRGGDKYGREGDQFCDPHPITETEFLVSYCPLGGYLFAKNGHVNEDAEEGRLRYKLYYMSWDGRRELLAAHPTLSCVQAVPMAPRRKPLQRGSVVNYARTNSYMYVQNVYYGSAAQGIAPGSIDRIRVVEMYYKPISVGASRWTPPSSEVGPGKPYAGLGTHSVTPTGVGTASFDAKGVLGEAQVHADGSAMFVVPARKPIYLQLINTNGVAVQTMRSWATLMPNEFFACIGCHEENKTAPPNSPITLAMLQPAQPLRPFAGRPQNESFSFARLVQPILDAKCASCHSPGGVRASYDLSNTIVNDRIDTGGSDSTRRRYYKSYLTLLNVALDRGDGTLGPGSPNQWVDYFTRLRTVAITPPYAFGSAQSGMIAQLRAGHAGVSLTKNELEILCAWIDLNVPFVGNYDEMNTWDTNTQQNYAKKVQTRKAMEAIERANINAYIQAGQPQ